MNSNLHGASEGFCAFPSKLTCGTEDHMFYIGPEGNVGI